MINVNPSYATKSRNPNIKPRWKTEGERKTFRLPTEYHQIALEICQAIDQGLISETKIRAWLAQQIDNGEALKEVEEILSDIQNFGK